MSFILKGRRHNQPEIPAGMVQLEYWPIDDDDVVIPDGIMQPVLVTKQTAAQHQPQEIVDALPASDL